MSLSTLGLAAAILGFFSALGAALDNLVLPHQNKKLQNVLLRWWDFVDDLRFRDIGHRMVDLYVAKERLLFGNFPSSRWFLTAIILSTVVTGIAIIGGRTIGLAFTLLCTGSTDAHGGVLGTLRTSLSASLGYFHNVDKLRVFSLNIGFDALTLCTTLGFLRLYLGRRRFLFRYSLVLSDIAACIAFFYVCSFLAFYSDGTTSGVRYGLVEYYKHFLWLWKEPQCTHFHIYTSTIVFSSTVFLPTFTYLSAILMVMTAKGSMESARYAARHLLELSATQQKSVFFYSGVFLGIIGSGMKLTYDVLTMLLKR